MIFKILLRYILGYVNIFVEGYYIERFINICLSKGILLWNVKREKSTYMHANIGVQDFKKIKQVARKTKCKVKLEQKKGLPFLMNRYRKRKIFFILLVVIAVVIFITSKYIWNIQIEGISTIQKDELLAELAENGLTVGTLKSKIDTQSIINNLRLKRDDIAWMNIDLSGTNVIVKVVETTKKPEIIDANEYCNIVSNKQAQITKITAGTGTILVNVRRYCNRRHNFNWWMDGRKIYRSKICPRNRRDRSKSMV